MKLVCKQCKQEINVNMYLYDANIVTKQYMPSSPVEYHATCRGRTICTYCGNEIHEYFQSCIDSRKLIELATGEAQ